MEIKIKQIGTAQGTVGWLSAGLGSGNLKLGEGKLTRNGNHGLWLKGGGVSQFLGAFNQYGIPSDEQCACYDHCSDEDRDQMWSDAAWGVLMTIADHWCALCNEAIEAESVPTLTITRVEAKLIA